MDKKNENSKIKVIHPGQYIKKNILSKKGMTQQALADIIGVSRQTINNLVQGNTKLTPAMAFRLANISQSADFWINMQKSFDKGTDKTNTTQNLLERWESLGPRTLVDHEIISGIKNDIFGMVNFSEENIMPASYDLRAGSEAIVTSENAGITNLEKETLFLKPSTTAILRTFEELEFPEYILGRLGPMTKLCQHGIITMFGIHVDPGFSGPLHVTLFNSGNNVYEIEFKDSFLSLEFHYLSVMPDRKYQGLNTNRKEFLEEELKTVLKSDRIPRNIESEYSAQEIMAAIQFLDNIKKF